jgi:replication factor C small subunit
LHDDPDNDVLKINIADFFDRTKEEIRDDPRFAHFLQGQTEFSKQYRSGTEKKNLYKRNWSKREMVAHVLKELAGYQPQTGTYKTILLDNAESIREDFQQALRRIMERYYETTQFIITTRQPSKLIPAIQSRCFLIPVRSPTTDEIRQIVARIADAEGVEYSEAGLRYVANYVDGNVREAIMNAQTIAVAEGEITQETAFTVLKDIGIRDEIEEMLHHALDNDFSDARGMLDDLLIDEGYTGEEVLLELLEAIRVLEPHDTKEIITLAGDIDFALAEGTNDRIQLSRFLADLRR